MDFGGVSGAGCWVFGEKLNQLLEAQRGATVLWAPVVLTFGIWFYFSLPQEPGLWLALLFAALAALAFWRAKGRMSMVLIAIFLSGFALAKLRTEMVATPLLKASSGDVVVAGIVRDSEGASAKRGTLQVQPTAIEGLTTMQLPRVLRLTNFTQNGAPQVGDRIAFKARLSPISSPTMPGGFDYGRQLYFEGIGGSGRITSKIDVLGHSTSAPLWLSGVLNDLRQEIGGRIRAHLQGTIAALADAMITGERAAIPKDINKSLQISGLAHILSISGLHMSLAAGGVFWVARALLALFPGITLNYPIKKWAAAAALAFGFIYMLLAGSQAATQRSYIMLAVVFLAIIVDRPAISLRNLALAALIILILQPESAIQASFQMSFMAVMGLAAFFEFWNRPRAEQEYLIESRFSFYARKSLRIVIASILTTVVAGAFSSIPAAYHFGRLSPYGVIANGLAIPVMSLVVMPFALLSVVLMPFGLEGYPLAVLGYGLDLVLAISDYVAGLPGAQRIIPQLPILSAIALAIGASVVCLVRGWPKLIGGFFLVVGALIAQFNTLPDLLIERTAANMAYRNDRGDLIFAATRGGKFAAEKWLQSNGEEASFKEAAARRGWICVGRSCRVTLNGKAIAYFTEGEGDQPSCDGLDIVVASYPLRGACKAVALRIDRFDVWRNGAHAISIDDGVVSLATAKALSGTRPWVVNPVSRFKFGGEAWRGASTHSPFMSAGSLPSDAKNNDLRPAQ
jgi:competence protein ComEC